MNIFEDFFNLSNDPMTIGDTNGRIVHANSVYTALTGWNVEELKTISYWDLIHPDDHEKVIAALTTLQAGHPIFALEYRFLCKDGTYKTFLANISQNKQSGHLYAISRLREGQVTSYIIVAEMAPVAVLIVNTEGTIIHSNRLAETLFGYEIAELRGKSIEELIPERLRNVHKEHRSQFQENPSNRPMGSYYNLKGMRKNGMEFRVDIALNPLYEQNELYVACSILDITEKVNTSELAQNLEKENLRLERLAKRDPLTQAYNRRSMEELFPKLAQDCLLQNKKISTMMMDLDHFKKYNDSYGHQTGDKLLKEFAHLTQKHIRENDILVRYGGEEFFVIMPNCDQPQAMEVAERIRTALEKELQLEYQITASFGVSTYDFQSTQIQDSKLLAKLIEESDQALYTAKKNGRNCARHFTPR